MLTKTNFALGALAGERDEKLGALDSLRVTPRYTEVIGDHQRSLVRISCKNGDSRSFADFLISANDAAANAQKIEGPAFVGHDPMGDEVFISYEPPSWPIKSLRFTKCQDKYPDTDKIIPSKDPIFYLPINLWSMKRLVDFATENGGEWATLSFWDAKDPLRIFSFLPNDQTMTAYLQPLRPGHRSSVGDRLEDLELATEDLERVIQRLEQRIDDLQYDKLQLEQELRRKNDLIDELLREPRKNVLVEDAAA